MIESLTLYIARKILIKLGKGSTPELLHSIKVLVLATEPLANFLIFHKFYSCIKFSEKDQSVFDFINSKSFDCAFSVSTLSTTDRAPKFLADTMEAIFGAIFMDGGWEALVKFFVRIAGPSIYFSCKYFESTVVDIIHDLIKFYQKQGKNAYLTDAIRDEKKGQYVVQFIVEEGGKGTVYSEGRSNEKEKARKEASIRAFEKVSKSIQDTSSK